MNSEVTITLKGEAIPGFLPIGVVINYGINRIPTAAVQLDPASLGLLCDFDAIRRTEATVSVETTNGCLYFDGVIDGLTFTQSPGGLSATLYLKHKMQWLTEVYPRIVGIHPSSINIFRHHPVLNVKFGDNGDNLIMSQLSQWTNMKPSVFTDMNLIDFFVALMIESVKSQGLIPITSDDGRTAGIQTIIKEADLNRKNLMPLVISLLESVDTTGTKKLEITPAARGIASGTIENIAMMRDNIFANLVRLISDMGACLVIGNRSAYIVPEATYLRVPKIANVSRTSRSTTPNVVYPAEYDGFIFNDHAFVNLKGVYVLHDQNTNFVNIKRGGSIEMGQFIDPNTSGNIVVTSMPAFVSYGLVEAAVYSGKGLQRRIKGGEPLLTEKILTGDSKINIDSSIEEINAGWETRRNFMNQWAQMEYCRMKYDDRNGSFSTIFNNKWVPGAVGTLYTRLPGTYLDYYVTDVAHTFNMTPPNSGKASTTVIFKGGRLGASNLSGLDSIDLYRYDYAEAQRFCSRFLTDIST